MVLWFPILYFTSAVGCCEMAKRRGIANSWIAFIPLIGLFFMLGSIVDNIFSYNGKVSYFRFVFAGLQLFPLGILLSGTIMTITMLELLQVYFWINKVVLFFIYKDYDPNKMWLFLASSVFLIILDYVYILGIRKNVPISMCLRKEDQKIFKANQPTLQLLWDEYHLSTYRPSWYEFLRDNFVPVR